jgi:hypothetical protein
VTTSPPPLKQQAEDFAGQINGLLLATVTGAVHLEAFQADLDQTLLVVGNQVDLGGHDQSNIAKLNGRPFPVTGLDVATLSATWVFVPSSSGSWLKSWSSSFILNVDGTPFVRLEVDPFKPEGSWLQAHIQVTAESRLLGYLRGFQKQKRTRLHQLHLPVGGFRFRPGMEDFLEFAIDEELIPGKDGWRDALEPTRTEFRRKQFMAMVADHPEWASEGLQRAEWRSE